MVASTPWKTTLTHLYTNKFSITPFKSFGTFCALLPEQSSLVDLRMSFEYMQGRPPRDKVLDLLRIQEGKDVVCPRLERLDLHFILFEADTLLEFLSSRLTPSMDLTNQDCAPCLERFTTCFPIKCLAGDKHAWSTDQRDHLDDLVNHLQQYNIVVPHEDDREEDLEIGNVDLDLVKQQSTWFY